MFKMKATSRLVGNLRFGFSLFGAANSDLPKNWKVVWSADNVNWNEGAQILSFKTDVITAPESLETTFELPGSANAGGYKLAIFNIPDNKAVAEGSYLYVKVCQADNVSLSGNPVDPAKQVIFINGFFLTTHEKRAYHTSNLPSGTNVLLAEGFDDAFWGPDYFIPSWQYFVSHKIAYAMPEKWEKTGSVFELRVR